MEPVSKKGLYNVVSGASNGEATARAVYKEELVDQLLSEWEFFLPKDGLAKRILKLNDEIGDEYFAKQYANLDKDSNILDIEESAEINEKLNDPSWHQRLFKQISRIVFHDERDFAGKSESEKIGFFQRYISERIYNHLAMLKRSPHAEEGGSFSLTNDFAEEIAGKIGLGLYFSDDISENLRAEIRDVLYDLAESFQDWFINKKNGHIQATFGEIYSFDKKDVAKDCEHKLILRADVRKSEIMSEKSEVSAMG